jgi:hypothetical protein
MDFLLSRMLRLIELSMIVVAVKELYLVDGYICIYYVHLKIDTYIEAELLELLATSYYLHLKIDKYIEAELLELLAASYYLHLRIDTYIQGVLRDHSVFEI